MATITEKSEILFIYETSYNIPNGDPFTGEQRYDEETKKILVSDVRVKRYIRSYLEHLDNTIFVSGAGESITAKTRIENLAKNQTATTDIGELMKNWIDVRLFGGISTLKDADLKKIKVKVGGKETECVNGHVQYTGPVQFALLNPSLNRVNMRMHQNTSHFTSRDDNEQGAIGTTTVVPYSVVQIHGWTNPTIAKETGMTDDDKQKMFMGLWYGTSGDGSSFSRSKIGQDSLLLLEIIYADSHKKIYGVDRLVKIKVKDADKKEEQIRSMDDFDFDFSKLIEAAKSDKVSKVRYYTEIDVIEAALDEVGEKLEKIEM
ncbi:MAG: type I CRISPR-associated protein Cas7 [Paludibacteraceae bacterium]|nr:type I CRISPR-associated protein Cas7 [Paludibacteraceae bacterium]